MSHLHRIQLATVSLGIAIWTTGCGAGGHGDDEPGDAAGAGNAAYFETTDGGEVNVFHDDDGALIVSIVEPAKSKVVLDDFSKGEADLEDLYVGLTGSDLVPGDVVALNEEFVASRAARSENPDDVDEVYEDAEESMTPAAAPEQGGSGRESLTRVNLTAAQFASDHCQNYNWDIELCYLNVTGTGYRASREHWVVTYAYSYRGTITHRIDRRYGSWSTKAYNTVPAGYLSYLERDAGGFTDVMRAGVWNADGDGYHLSIKMF